MVRKFHRGYRISFTDKEKIVWKPLCVLKSARCIIWLYCRSVWFFGWNHGGQYQTDCMEVPHEQGQTFIRVCMLIFWFPIETTWVPAVQQHNLMAELPKLLIGMAQLVVLHWTSWRKQPCWGGVRFRTDGERSDLEVLSGFKERHWSDLFYRKANDLRMEWKKCKRQLKIERTERRSAGKIAGRLPAKI